MPDRSDETEIRRLIESWAIWRDTGDFDRLATTWHEDGRMVTTGGETSAAQFISNARRGWAAGLDVVHAIGGMSIDVEKDRAIAQSRATISQRASLDGIVCDVDCRSRFIDLLERRNGRWGFVLRHPTYDRDSISTVDGSPLPALDQDRLNRFPVGYRHLAYLQSSQGMPIQDGLPGRNGPAMEALWARAQAWLHGE